MSLVISNNYPSSPTLNFDCDEEPVITDEQLIFFASWTGVEEKDQLSQLRERVLLAWRRVKSETHVFRCVQRFGFLKPRSSSHPSIGLLLARLAEDTTTIVGDLGCCFGQDIRSLLLSGVPPSRLLAIDLHDVYWRHGESLFDAGSPLSVSGVATCFGDWAAPVVGVSSPSPSPSPSSSVILPPFPVAAAAALELSVTSSDVASPYAGRLAGCLSMFVLHTLSFPQSVAMLSRVWSCLAPGGVLVGACVGCGIREGIEWRLTPDGSAARFLHSTDTLGKLLRELGYDDVLVEEWAREGQGGDAEQRSRPSKTQEGDEGVPHVSLAFSARRPTLLLFS